MKKIAIITPCMLPVPATKGGAVETLITELLNENELRGDLDIDVYSMSDCDSAPASFSKARIINVSKSRAVAIADRVLDKIYRMSRRGVSARRIYDNKIIGAVLHEIQDNGIVYEAIIVENMMSTAVKLLKHKGTAFDCPVYCHIHNDIDIYRSPEYTAKLAGAGVRFIAVSEYIKGRIKEACKDADVSLLLNGVNTEVFDKSLCEKAGEIRAELGLDAGDLIIQYSGRIIPEKGVIELVRAFNLLCKNEPEQVRRVRLNIIGMSQGEASEYEELVRKEASLNPYINLVTRCDETLMARYYAASDLVVVPSVFNEPFGMVALEAVAMGKGVIATNSGGLPEILNGDYAVPVGRDDLVNNLKEAMLKVINHSDIAKMGESAYKMFLSRPEFGKAYYFDNFIMITGRK